MKVLCIAQVEDRENIDKQILKQTRQPDRVIFLVDKNPAKTLEERRIRIAENHKKLREIVKAYPEYDYIWQVEQDGDYPEDTLERLIADLDKVDVNTLAYISGIQVGRHGLYCLGAWVEFRINSFKSLDYRLKGLQRVMATGFYCLLAPRNKWLEGEATWSGQPWGPDVNWGHTILGVKYVDMDIQIGHIIKSGTIRVSGMSTCNVEYYKRDGAWEYKQLD